MYVITWGERTKTEAGFFQWYKVTEQETVGTDWNMGVFIWTSGNTFSTVRVTEQWHRLPIDSPPLQISNSYLDMVLANWIYVALPEQWGAAQDDVQKSLPTSVILQFFYSVLAVKTKPLVPISVISKCVSVTNSKCDFEYTWRNKILSIKLRLTLLQEHTPAISHAIGCSE